MNLEGKVAVITGGARGIGFAIAQKLSSLGAKVALVDISEQTLAESKEKIVSAGGEAEYFVCDVSDWEQVQKTASAVLDRFGRVDILVNNAGITRDNLIMKMSPEDWDLVMNVNLKGAFLFIKAFVRHMMKNRYGKIINIASVVGLFGNAAQANYAASKAGLIGLTKSVAKELASRGIRCDAVAPGFIETDMTKNLPQQAIDAFLSATPLKYPGKPEDVANVVAFLAAPESDYITGEVIRVDGGMAM